MFNVKLRDETDLDQIMADFVQVAEQTLQPAQVSLWLREGGPYRSGGSH
jgi:hypothetical protein